MTCVIDSCSTFLGRKQLLRNLLCASFTTSTKRQPRLQSIISCGNFPKAFPGKSCVSSYLFSPRLRPKACATSFSSRRSFTLSAKTRVDPELLKGVDPDNVELVGRIVEKGLRAVERWDVEVSDFLTPPELQDANLALKRIGDCETVSWGGYPQAERQRLEVGRSEQMTLSGGGNSPDEMLALVSVEGNFMFDPADHRDFLGAILGTGIERTKVGDIVMQGEKGAQILIVPELVKFVESSMTSVRSVPVTVSRIGLEKLNVRPPKVDTMRTVEASLRLDAIASAGFRMPRSKCSELISKGDVKVNWKGPLKPSRTINSGDVISIRGKGRLEVGEISKTKKDRFAVELTRYL